MNTLDPLGLEDISVSGNGLMSWVIEKDGFLGFNKEVRAVLIGKLDGKSVSLLDRFGGGSVDLRLLRKNASRFWNNFNDISGQSRSRQDDAISLSLDMTRSGRSLSSGLFSQMGVGFVEGWSEGSCEYGASVVSAGAGMLDMACWEDGVFYEGGRDYLRDLSLRLDEDSYIYSHWSEFTGKAFVITEVGVATIGTGWAWAAGTVESEIIYGTVGATYVAGSTTLEGVVMFSALHPELVQNTTGFSEGAFSGTPPSLAEKGQVLGALFNEIIERIKEL